MKTITGSEAAKILYELADKVSELDTVLIISSVSEKDSISTYGDIKNGIDLINHAKAIIYSSTPAFGSFDLYDRPIADIMRVEFKEGEIVKNILFPRI